MERRLGRLLCMRCMRCEQPAHGLVGGLPTCRSCLPAMIVIVEAAMTFYDEHRHAAMRRSDGRCALRQPIRRFRPFDPS